MPINSAHPLPVNPTTGQQPLASLGGVRVSSGSGSTPGMSVGGGVSRDTLKVLQDVAWSDDEVSRRFSSTTRNPVHSTRCIWTSPQHLHTFSSPSRSAFRSVTPHTCADTIPSFRMNPTVWSAPSRLTLRTKTSDHANVECKLVVHRRSSTSRHADGSVQICQFCYNRLLNSDARCPGCRRPYDSKAVVFQPVDWEE